MSEPVLRTPLGLRRIAFARADGETAVLLEEAPFRARIGLRAGEDAAVRIGAALGLDLPGAMLRTSAAGDVEALRLGPEEWLVLAAGTDGEKLVAKIEEAAAGAHVAAVDLSHRFAEILVSGAAARDVLAAGCPLDLDPSVLPLAFASRSLLGKSEIVLQWLGDDRFRLLVNRSFADYCWRFLENAAAEQGRVVETVRS